MTPAELRQMLDLVKNGQLDASKAHELLLSALRDRTGTVVPKTSMESNEQTQSEAKRRLGAAAYATAWSEGRAMSLPQATVYAMGQTPPTISSS